MSLHIIMLLDIYSTRLHQLRSELAGGWLLEGLEGVARGVYPLSELREALQQGVEAELAYCKKRTPVSDADRRGIESRKQELAAYGADLLEGRPVKFDFGYDGSVEVPAGS